MKKMSMLGIGHKLIGFTLLYFIAALILTLKYTWIFYIAIYDATLLKITGGVVLAVGSVFYAVTLKTFIKNYKEGKLVKTGTYSMCRNPLYASWILFFIPAAAMMINSWIVFSASLFMYILLRIMIGEEEENLEKLFREEYIKYKKGVNLVLPVQRWGDAE